MWAIAGPTVVTRYGAILAEGKHVVLDPELHGVCHRMRTPDDLSPRAYALDEHEHGDQRVQQPQQVEELFVLSQPWGHTVFHYITECLPKVAFRSGASGRLSALARPSCLSCPRFSVIPNALHLLSCPLLVRYLSVTCPLLVRYALSSTPHRSIAIARVCAMCPLSRMPCVSRVVWLTACVLDR